MKPALDNFPICIGDIDAVRQNLFVREKKRASPSSAQNRHGLDNLLLIPKADG